MTKIAVVLAAGRGSRLGCRTDACSKALVPLAGRPIIHHVLTSLAGAGISEAVVVLGHGGEELEANLGDGRELGIRLRYVWNRDYMLGNASSLWRALPLVGNESFLLVMGDHICSSALFATFLAGANGCNALAIDRSDLGAERTAEATKVTLRNGGIVDIGKELTRWDAIDTGVFCWRAGAFASFGEAPPKGEISVFISRLARSGGGLHAVDVSGQFWLDIDTEDDLSLAERLLQADERLLN